jgi:hypothetical protein
MVEVVIERADFRPRLAGELRNLVRERSQHDCVHSAEHGGVHSDNYAHYRASGEVKKAESYECRKL